MGVLEKIRDIEAGTFIALLRSDGGVLKLTCAPHRDGPDAEEQGRSRLRLARIERLSGLPKQC
jgi:hypothetical protein